jgi:aminoglycoside phosphotransferase (APT) family kinase protein
MTARQEKFSGTKTIEERHQFDAAALDRYLHEHLAGYRGPLDVVQFRGGQSCPTYLLEAGAERYVLRRKPPGVLLPSAHAVDREYRVITALAKTEVPVPRTFCLCTDDAIIGTWFFVMEYVEGRVLWEPLLPGLTPGERGEIYDAMNDVLTRLHGVDVEAVGLTDFGKPGNYFARQIHRWSKQYRASETRRIEAMKRLMEWLPENIPPADETTLVHGDYRLDNMIMHPTRNEVIAILDWELSTLGHPLGDLTYHCMGWELGPENANSLGGADLEKLGIPTLERYVAAYCRRTGREGIDHWSFYMAYNFFRSAAIAQGIVGRVRDGTAASEHARELEASVQPTAELAWRLAQRS